MEEKEFDFEQEYNILKGEHNLPELEILCEDFDIDKAGEKETNFLLRDIRRIMNEKFSGYLHLFENLINPNSPPMFILAALRGLESDDKKVVRKVYDQLSKMQIKVLRLDTSYSEEAEAKFIVQSFNEWQDLKGQILNIIDSLDQSFEKREEVSRRAYFG